MLNDPIRQTGAYVVANAEIVLGFNGEAEHLLKPLLSTESTVAPAHGEENSAHPALCQNSAEMPSIEQSIKDQYAKLFCVADWPLGI